MLDGPERAVALMQQALGVQIDGMVGEKTAKAANAGADAEALARFLRFRLDYYRGQAERKPKKAKFLGGWERRLFLVLIAALELDLRAALRGLNAAT